MDAAEISRLVEREIDGNWSRSNAHGVDLRRCLVTPTKGIYEDCSGSGTIELWAVLEEVPEDQSGYKIVFDERTGSFGLATRNFPGRPDGLIGFYGSFLETLEAM